MRSYARGLYFHCRLEVGSGRGEDFPVPDEIVHSDADSLRELSAVEELMPVNLSAPQLVVMVLEQLTLAL